MSRWQTCACGAIGTQFIGGVTCSKCLHAPPARRLTHKDAKAAAELYGLTYDEVRALALALNQAARRKERIGQMFGIVASNGLLPRDEQKVQETDGT